MASSSRLARLYKVEPYLLSTSYTSSVSHAGLVFQSLKYQKVPSASGMASADPAAWNVITPELVGVSGSSVGFQLMCSFPQEPPPSLAFLFSLHTNFLASSHLCNCLLISSCSKIGFLRAETLSLSLILCYFSRA